MVAYFTRTGNTRVIAHQIRRALQADLFEIEPAAAYPEDYEQTVAQAVRERDSGDRPPLKAKVPEIRAYEAVFLGFPIWGETAPPVIRSFLSQHDLSAKALVPFITHGGYGVGRSMTVVREHAPRASVLNPFVMEADQERRTLTQVSRWLSSVNVRASSIARPTTPHRRRSRMAGKHRTLTSALLLASAGIMVHRTRWQRGVQACAAGDPGTGELRGRRDDDASPGVFDPLKPTAPAGQTYRGDHAYAFYQIPQNPRKLPLVLWHGAGQFSKTWETTADGREGYQNIFLRRSFPVYVIDQPRRGDAGRSMVQSTITPTPDEQLWFGMFRIGLWPNYFPGVQFSKDPEALNQYFRSMTPNTGPFDVPVITSAVSALFDKIGPGILVTHSQSGGPGWVTAIKNRNVKAIVAYEPGSGFIFPEGEVPASMPSAMGPLEGAAVPLADFMQLTKIPIVIYYGDNIPEQPTASPTEDNWRVRLAMARLWRDAVNRHGGDVTLVHLPELGIRGNTHFPFSDLNNVQIADLMSEFLKKKNLD